MNVGTQTLPSIKSGKCREPSGFGICIQKCNTDINCPGQQKCVSFLGCLITFYFIINRLFILKLSNTNPYLTIFKCSNGCGHVCMNPIL